MATTAPFFLLVAVVEVTVATSTLSRYSRLETGEGTTGNVDATYSWITLDECLLRYAKKTILKYLGL